MPDNALESKDEGALPSSSDLSPIHETPTKGVIKDPRGMLGYAGA